MGIFRRGARNFGEPGERALSREKVVFRFFEGPQQKVAGLDFWVISKKFYCNVELIA